MIVLLYKFPLPGMQMSHTQEMQLQGIWNEYCELSHPSRAMRGARVPGPRCLRQSIRSDMHTA